MGPELITRNFGWKALSLSLAVVIWLSVKAISSEQGQTERMYIGLPVQIVSGTADVRAFSLEPDEVRVTLKGSPDTIKKLNEREIRVLTDITSAETTEPFRRKVQVALPNGYSVVRIEPADVLVTPPPKPEPRVLIISTNQ